MNDTFVKTVSVNAVIHSFFFFFLFFYRFPSIYLRFLQWCLLVSFNLNSEQQMRHGVKYNPDNTVGSLNNISL